MNAKGKKKRTVLLGVTGSIAAYKACELVRLFVKNGDDVHVVMTRNACEFVTPLTFQTLSRNPVACRQFDEPADWRPGHISLAEAADVVVVAPATANIIAKMAHGIADDMLSSILLATRAPIVVAPAMNAGMYENAATQANLETLRSRGVNVVEPASGELACGTSGMGRLAELSDILAFAAAL
jgi:phosphopantothenoylcysteine decarboxylase/phosphopantothenate--cysteine ligase